MHQTLPSFGSMHSDYGLCGMASDDGVIPGGGGASCGTAPEPDAGSTVRARVVCSRAILHFLGQEYLPQRSREDVKVWFSRSQLC